MGNSFYLDLGKEGVFCVEYLGYGRGSGNIADVFQLNLTANSGRSLRSSRDRHYSLNDPKYMQVIDILTEELGKKSSNKLFESREKALENLIDRSFNASSKLRFV